MMFVPTATQYAYSHVNLLLVEVSGKYVAMVTSNQLVLVVNYSVPHVYSCTSLHLWFPVPRMYTYSHRSSILTYGTYIGVVY